MQFETRFQPALQAATLIKRYKRFLADVQCADGSLLTIHCPNTGAMTGCASPGDTVWFSTSANPKRKYPHTWELTHTATGDWICVNTGKANELVSQALQLQAVPSLQGYRTVQREVAYAEGSRVDIKLSDGDQADAYVEVKSVTLCTAGQGYFPDAVSLRGHKHLHALMAMKQAGYRAVLVYAVLHSAIQNVQSAVHIDPRYAELTEQAKAAGVEFVALHFQIDSEKISGITKIS